MSDTAKWLIKCIIILSVIALLAGAFFVPRLPDGLRPVPIYDFSALVEDNVTDSFVFPPYLGYAIGLLLGCAVSILKVFLLDKTVGRVVSIEKADNAKAAMSLAYSSRFLLTGAVLLFAVFVLGFAGIIGAFAGTLALTVSAYLVKLFEGKQDNIK